MSKIYFNWRNLDMSLKRIWQNIIKGWNDSDCWNLDYIIAKFILPRLKRFNELIYSHPSTLTITEWHEVLNKMIFSFESIIENEEDFIESTEEREHKIQEGLYLFSKYFKHLWD